MDAQFKDKAKKWISEEGEDRELWTFLDFNQLIDLVIKDKGKIDFWGEIFEQDILDAGFVSREFWRCQ